MAESHHNLTSDKTLGPPHWLVCFALPIRERFLLWDAGLIHNFLVAKLQV